MKTALIKYEYASEIVNRIAGELKAERMYRDFANLANFAGLFGAEEYFRHEAKDEGEHMAKLCAFLNDAGVSYPVPNTPDMELPEGARLIDLLRKAYDAEVELYDAYQALCKACGMDDVSVHNLCLEFVEIQRKAVAGYADLIARLEQEGDIYAFDLYMKSLA